jgi:hypothetical protein
LDKARAFSRNEVRLQLSLDSHVASGYTAIFQAMRIDHPGGAPDIPERYRRVFKVLNWGFSS